MAGSILCHRRRHCRLYVFVLLLFKKIVAAAAVVIVAHKYLLVSISPY